jgi:coproporphyrinogen III oxidase-like Fe-S oxidoreductase
MCHIVISIYALLHPHIHDQFHFHSHKHIHIDTTSHTHKYAHIWLHKQARTNSYNYTHIENLFELKSWLHWKNYKTQKTILNLQNMDVNNILGMGVHASTHINIIKLEDVQSLGVGWRVFFHFCKMFWFFTIYQLGWACG